MREAPGLWPWGKQAAGLKGPASSVKAPWLPQWFQPLSFIKRTGAIALGSWRSVGRPLSAKLRLCLCGDEGEKDDPEPETASTGAMQAYLGLGGWRLHQCLYPGENKLTVAPCQSKNLL